MLRPVWFGQRNADGDIELKDSAKKGAAFLLFIRYVEPVRGKYKIIVKATPRDEKIARLIERHHLRQAEVYVDKARVAADEHQQELSAQMQADFEADGLGYIWSPHLWMWMGVKKFAASVQQARTLKINFGTLLDGREISGGMDELRRLVFAITETIDRLNSQIATGELHDTGAVRIFSPGDKGKPPAKPKPGKPTTAPSEW